jgi:hypothetical protein
MLQSATPIRSEKSAIVNPSTILSQYTVILVKVAIYYGKQRVDVNNFVIQVSHNIELSIEQSMMNSNPSRGRNLLRKTANSANNHGRQRVDVNNHVIQVSDNRVRRSVIEWSNIPETMLSDNTICQSNNVSSQRKWSIIRLIQVRTLAICNKPSHNEQR